jgi:TolA-binding protein
MRHLLKYWPVVVGTVGAIAWLITGSIELGEIKSESKHQNASAEEQRVDLQEEDVRLHRRIDKTDRKINRLKGKVDMTSESVIRIETNQTTILKNQDRIYDVLQKLER